MPGLEPQALCLRYSDGSQVEVPFADLPLSLQADLMRQPPFCGPSPDPGSDKYVVVEWEDGWKEVVRVDPSCTAFKRYYVISRTEEVGRLSLETTGDYPQLLQLDRRPMGVCRVIFGEPYAVTLRSSEREGKKTDHWFALEPDPAAPGGLRRALLAAAEAEGVSLADLRAGGATEAQRAAARAVAARIGLVAGGRQQDLYDFMASAVAGEREGEG